MGERIRVIKRMEEPKEYKIEKDMKNPARKIER